MKEKWSCYDCMWATDKCKNKDNGQYDKFLNYIENCDYTGEVDNSLGCSWRDLGESID